ncbi:L,D-transpeptidase family protein [Methylopila turkensis]|uniref:L,D-transpeptidase family protein n=1 Tax=Methylopila turkensis TaxID=1437816 RepID=UPI0022F2C0B6|nr:L,D-transpeptidase family protein [Methylopila turkensis]
MTIRVSSAPRRAAKSAAPARIWRAAALGASLTALMTSAALAQSAPVAATAETQQAAADPATPASTELATGSVDAAAPTENDNASETEGAAAAPATPAPVDSVHATDPLQAAVGALLATDGAGVSLKLPRADRQALVAFYAARNGSPAWIADGRFTPAAEAAIARIAQADADGLEAKRFNLPAQPSSTEPAVLARAEVALTAAALSYARQAWGGRVNPAVISRSIEVGTSPFDAGAALVSITASQDVAATLDGFNPPHPEFQGLRKLLAGERARLDEQRRHPLVGMGKTLRPGAEDDRVPSLRARLDLPEKAGDLVYDDALVAAVQAFQKTNKLGADGVVGAQTVRALNAEARVDRTALILVNMERWRWMPRDLGAKHVFVDLADFHLHIVEDGRETYETRVIIGKASNQTPMLSSAINLVVVNPYWNVPVSIAMNEMAGGSLRGYEVVDSRGRVVPTGAVDWQAVRAGKMRIRQEPGERNALGHIKFMFPNNHSVYLHDTPSRKLFGNDFRALSHGCVRVDRPLEFADALTGAQGLDGARLQKMIGGKERGLPLSQTIPVHLAYFTAVPGPDGALETRRDLYEQDDRIRAALAGEQIPALPPAQTIARAPRPAKPASRPAPEQAQVVEQRAPQQQGFGSWLSRVFGDSRARP